MVGKENHRFPQSIMSSRIYSFIFLSVFIAACSAKIEPVNIDKAQLRRTLREHTYQFNFDLILQLQGRGQKIGISALDVTVNDTYLGKSVIAAETEEIPAGRYPLPLRVTFPSSALVLTTPNIVKVSGTLVVNGKEKHIEFTDEDVQVLNMVVQ